MPATSTTGVTTTRTTEVNSNLAPAQAISPSDIAVNPNTAEIELEHDSEDVDLRHGIDAGDPLTVRGRIKKRPRDADAFDPDDPDRYRYKAYHIRRAFDLFGHIPTIINDGIKRRAKEAAGEISSNIQSDQDYETFGLIVNHLHGLDEDIVRLKRRPKEFRTLVRKIREAADQARNNDTANLKKDISCMLTADGCSVLTTIAKGKKASSKHDRGFDNDVMGRYLCPISLDWDDDIVRKEIRDGEHAILACDWPRLLYTDCHCDLDDLELGLGRNMALVRVVKYLFTGRSAAFSETPGGKTTRSGNAALAGMTEVTPRVVAYAACMLRYAISNEESWTMIDKEFNLQEFYWHVVNIFDDSDEFGKDLLAWWNMKVFGKSLNTTIQPEVSTAPKALSILRSQRQAKRAAARGVLGDITNIPDDRHSRTNHFERPLVEQLARSPYTAPRLSNTYEYGPRQYGFPDSLSLGRSQQTDTRAPLISPFRPLQSHNPSSSHAETALQVQAAADPSRSAYPFELDIQQERHGGQPASPSPRRHVEPQPIQDRVRSPSTFYVRPPSEIPTTGLNRYARPNQPLSRPRAMSNGANNQGDTSDSYGHAGVNTRLQLPLASSSQPDYNGSQISMTQRHHSQANTTQITVNTTGRAGACAALDTLASVSLSARR